MGWGGVNHLLQVPVFTTSAAVSYLLRATWDSASDQGYTDGQVLDTAAEGVEDGSLTVIENDGTLACSSNKLAFTAQSTPAWGDQGIYSNSVTKTLGYTLLGTINKDATNKYALVAWEDDTSYAYSTSQHYLYFRAAIIQTNTDWLVSGSQEIGVYAASTDYQFAIVLGGYDSSEVPWRSGETAANYDYGAAFFVKGGTYTNWTLLWKHRLNNTSTLYAHFADLTDFNLIITDEGVPEEYVQRIQNLDISLIIV